MDRGGPARLLREDRALRRSLQQTDAVHRRSERTRNAAGTAASREAAAIARNTTTRIRETRQVEISEAKQRRLSAVQAQSQRTAAALASSSTRTARAHRAQGDAAAYAERREAALAAEAARAARIQEAAARRQQATADVRRRVADGTRGFFASTVRRGAGTAAIGAGFAGFASVGETIGWDRGMRNVNSIAQLSERSLARLERRVLRLAGPTAQAPQTLAEGLYDLVSSGFRAGESVGILEKTAKAATAGLTDTATSTGAVAAVLNAYRLRADDAGMVSDTLFRIVDRGVIGFDELARTIGTTLPFAATLGVEVGSVGASIATMTKQGIRAPQTMTRIEAVMRSLIRPSRELKAAYRDLGVESGEQLIRQRGWQGALLAIAQTAGGSQERLGRLFQDSEALAGVLALTGRNARSAKHDVRGFLDVEGATDRALSQQGRSISVRWERLKANAKALAIDLGTFLVPAMTESLQVGTVLVKDFFGGLAGRDARAAATGAHDLGAAFRDITQTAAPMVEWLKDAAVDVAQFAAAHPEVRMLAAALVTAGLAAKGIRFVGALTGLNQLMTLLPRATALVRRHNAAETAANVGGGAAGAAAARERMTLLRARDSYHVQRALGDSRRGAAMTSIGGFARGRYGAIAGGLGAGAAGAAFIRPDRLSAGGVLTGAAAGAGIGMMAGPVGAAVGGVVGGLSAAIVGGLRGAATKKAEEAAAAAAADIRRRAEQAMAGGMRRPIATRFAAASASGARTGGDLREAQQRLAELRRQEAQVRRTLTMSNGDVTPVGRMQLDRISEDIRDEIAEIARLQGDARRAARGILDGLRINARGFRFLDRATILRDFTQATEGLPPRARAVAAKSLLEMARGWERSGRLPRGSVRRLRDELARDFRGMGPLLSSLGVRAGRQAAASVDRGIRATRMTDRVNRTVQGAARAFQGLPRQMGRSLPGATAILAGSIREMESRIRTLREQARSGTEEQRRQAGAALGAHEKTLGRMKTVYAGALTELRRQYGATEREADKWATSTGEAIRRATSEGRTSVAELTTALQGLRTEMLNLPSMPSAASIAPAVDAPIVPPRRRRRAGGPVRGYQGGGLVDVMLSPGEELIHGGRSWIVPGTPTAADSVYARVPNGTAVLTWDGQALMGAGASLDQALTMQMPHFGTGGRVDRFRRGGRAGRDSGGPWVRIGATVFDDPPPGAFGSLTRGFAELGTARRTDGGATGFGWLAKAFGRSGELPGGTEVDFRVGSRIARLRKADRGYGQGGDGRTSDPAFAADFWRDSWDDLGIHGNWKGTAYARPASGRLASSKWSYMKPPRIARPRLIDLLTPYGASDALMQGFDFATSGIGGSLFRGVRGTDSDLFRAATSGVRPNAADLPRRVTVRGAAGARGAAGGSSLPRVRAMLDAGREIAGKPYVYGGGHGSLASVASGYDCSSTVSYILHRGGLLGGTAVTTDSLKTWGKPGGGRFVTVGVRGTTGTQAHTMLRIGNHFFEGSRPTLGWRSGWSGTFPIHRHPPGMRRGGRAGQPLRVGAAARRRGVHDGDPRLEPTHPRFLGWGLRHGGRVRIPGFRGGGMVGRNRRASRGAARSAELQQLDAIMLTVGAAPNGASRDVVDHMRTLAGTLERAELMTYERLMRLRASVESEIRDLHQGGVTGRERIQIRRLRGTLTLIDASIGARLGAGYQRAQDALDAVEVRRTRVSQRLAIRGVDEASSGGLEATERADTRSLADLRSQMRGTGGLRQTLRRARAQGDPALVARIREQIRTVRDAMRGLVVDAAVRVREIAIARAQERIDLTTGAIDRMRAGADRQQRTAGIDPSSAAGLRAGVGLDEREVGERRLLVAHLQRQAAMATNPKAAKAISDQIKQAREDLDESLTRLAESRRALVVAQAQERVDAATFGTDLAQAGLAGLDITQRGARTADTAGGMRERSRAIQDQLVPQLHATAAALEQQHRALLSIGDVAGARQAQLAVMQAGNDLASALVDAAELMRDAARRAAQDLVDNQTFELSYAQIAMQGVDIRHRRDQQTDTAAGMRERASVIQQTLMPQLQAMIAAYEHQWQVAGSLGDREGSQQAYLAMHQAGNDLAAAMAEVAELMRDAAKKAAQDLVDSASHGTTMADLGRTRLELEQRIAGTYEAGGTARADYIRAQIIPRLQAEIDALTRQQQTARETGDLVLARQIAEAIYAKETDVLQATLDAIQAIEENTRPRRVGGTTGFAFGDETLTDALIAVGNGT